MSVRSNRSEWVSTTALSWREVLHRFSFVLFLAASLGLLVVEHNKPGVIEQARVKVMDSLTPVFATFSRPMAMASAFSARIQSYRELIKENEKLRSENATLMRWQNEALALAHENKDLRTLLHYKAEPSLAYISARVIAETGGAFVRSLLVTAGRVDGVREGMAAMTGEGLVGRVIEVGDWSSRVLLLTDMNARIPVMVTDTGDHAILAGDNSPTPKLLYLPQDADVKIGARVMTSGHGGIFPPNIPVGVVSNVSHGVVDVAPIASLGRINQIRLIDFNLEGGAFNPMAAKAQPGANAP